MGRRHAIHRMPQRRPHWSAGHHGSEALGNEPARTAAGLLPSRPRLTKRYRLPGPADAAARYRPQPGTLRVRRPVAAAHPGRLLRRAAADRGPGAGSGWRLPRCWRAPCWPSSGTAGPAPAVAPATSPKNPSWPPGRFGHDNGSGRRPGRCGQNASRRSGHKSYSSAMARRTRRRCLRPADPDAVLAQLRSPDARVRVKALHRICPCRAGFPLHERFRSEVRRLQAAEQGWRYSDAGWVSRLVIGSARPPATGCRANALSRGDRISGPSASPQPER